MKNNLLFKKGFTLIELLVVVSIIGLLSTVVISSLTRAKMQSRDAQRKIEFNQLVKALNFYYDKYGTYPPNMVGTVSPYYDNFNNMAQVLVNEGFLTKVPVSPCGATCSWGNGGYAYYRYATGGTGMKSIMVTTLEAYPASSTGAPGSCRQGGSWCDADVSRDYCMCFY